jgi:hypothetical protein
MEKKIDNHRLPVLGEQDATDPPSEDREIGEGGAYLWAGRSEDLRLGDVQLATLTSMCERGDPSDVGSAS